MILFFIFIYINSGSAQESCGNRNLFLCTSGECVSKEFLCDGSRECTDGSDETRNLCRHRSCSQSIDYIDRDPDDILAIPTLSNPQVFRCGYGACISRFFLCDGIKHCVADGSDETEELCKDEQCRPRQFQCKYGACVARNNACDNRYHCYDGSDETPEACHWRRRTCTSRKFKCKYGACIKLKLKCDAVIDCLDGSDESEETCGPRPNLVLNSSLPIPSNPLLLREGGSTTAKTTTTTTTTPAAVVVKTDAKGCLQTDNSDIYLEILACGDQSFCDSDVLPVGTLMLIYCDETPVPLQCQEDYLWHFARDPSKAPRKYPCLDNRKTPPNSGGNTNVDLHSTLPTLPCGILPLFSPIPWLVGLFRLGEFSCTGTVIGPSLILTAGHCIVENQASNNRIIKPEHLKIQFNSPNPNDRKQFVSVSSIMLHPQYSGGKSPRNDAALLFLKKNLEKDHGLSSACLDKEGKLLNVEAFTFNRTFGQIFYRWENFRQNLDTTCFNLATGCSRHLNIGKNQFCAVNADSPLYLHQGSSGGPYMIKSDESGKEIWSVAGIVSNSVHTTECGTPHTVFTSVSKIYDWIFNCGFHGKCST